MSINIYINIDFSRRKFDMPFLKKTSGMLQKIYNWGGIGNIDKKRKKYKNPQVSNLEKKFGIHASRF